MKMVLSGLNHMHVNHTVHRDIKPGNCLLDNKFQLNIIDFGLALETEKLRRTANSTFYLGTPRFMAPEVFRQYGDILTYREPVDIWASGIMMYYLLTNRFPYEDEKFENLSESIMNDPINFNTNLLKTVPSEAIDLMRKMLNKQPKDRITAEQCL